MSAPSLAQIAEQVPLGFECRGCGGSAYNWIKKCGTYVETGQTCCANFKEWVRRAEAGEETPEDRRRERERLRKESSVTNTKAWMTTYSGRRFYPLAPNPDHILIEDVAHHLSMQTRYAGACVRFYSVAEHCVHLARCAPQEHKLWALLHDASEAYLQDLVRTVKRELTNYMDIEARLMAAVCLRFGLDPEMPYAVKRLDNRIVINEVRDNMRQEEPDMFNFGGETEPLPISLMYWTPEQAEAEFLSEFGRLTGRSDLVSEATPWQMEILRSIT